ncbi:cytochrome P450 [Phlebopus sp. FC_14]|nr:cytochrome P450 [Phlebopus sp. FC_14]
MASISFLSFERVVLWCCPLAVAALFLLHRTVTPPRAIRHLPCVPILPLLRSYLLREPDDVRFQRLIMPFADEKGEGVVVVWTLGLWMIHIIDRKLFAQVITAYNMYPKARISPGTMFVRFMGSLHIGQLNGDEWKRKSSLVQGAFAQPLPIDLFTSLSRSVFEAIEATSSDSSNSFTVCLSDIAQNFALDAVGTSLLGYHFDALRVQSPFVNDYNQMMDDIANPLYLVFPVLKRLLPRLKVMARVDHLLHKFQQLIDAKRSEPRNDIITFLLNDSGLSQDALLSNVAALFIASHDTTAGAMSTLVYHLAVDRHVQAKAREEVLRVLGPTKDPSVALIRPHFMPYLNACIHEALRINPPASVLPPRICRTDFSLGKYHIPAGSQLMANIYAVHHRKSIWNDPGVFRPERFLEGKQEWLPFSIGPRQSPGQNFAQYEMRTLAAMLLRRYEWTLPEGSIHARGLKNALFTLSLMVPKDLDITFRPLDGQKWQ